MSFSPRSCEPGKGIGIGKNVFGTGGSYRSPLQSNKKTLVDRMTVTHIPADRDNVSPPTTPRGRQRERQFGTKYQDKYRQTADKPGRNGWPK